MTAVKSVLSAQAGQGARVVAGPVYVTANGQRTTLSAPNNALANGHPRDDETARLSRLYYQRRLRSLSVGDIVCVGEVALAVGRPAGWEPASGPLAEGPHPRARHQPAPAPRAAGRPLTPGRRTTVNEKKTVTAPGEAAGQ